MPTLKTIAQLGDPVLRLQAEAIASQQSAEINELMADMLFTLAESGGVGLAAPQVAASLRLIIVASKPTPRYPDAPSMTPTLMLNPSFTPLSETMEKGWEGCLSILGIRALVPRYTKISVKYIDVSGQQQASVLEGFVARIFQHEFDHLEGLVYLDRVESTRDIVSETEYFKRFAA